MLNVPWLCRLGSEVWILENLFLLRHIFCSGVGFVGKTYNNSEAVRRAIGFLLSTQNEEGGWGESLESCPSMKYQLLEGNRTNLVQTSWAMMGLLYGGQVSLSTS
ncbi:hypothetical protein RHMOL_Rhmol03G0105300 [Rhododendron molle]|uniref:Uncharacterized protein n=1 Tax=Rhododendron molle TaxID=49168 RepID=A0ACC0PCR3_RHOML|nr:hypothetical protein RHMOL_Rhmol03G0105300 [Rhododendron molle]